MSKKTVYLGIRIEMSNRFLIAKNFISRYNKAHKKTRLFDLHRDGKITVEKKNSMIMARGIKNDRPYGGLINFSIMTEVRRVKEAERIVKIVNVLGNDRLIRERVSLFVQKQSMLNAIPELTEIRNALIDIDNEIPGFVKSGWYYAPEARF